MTAQLLTTELSNLIQESKRKSPELRNAAEKSLEELKALRVTSEAQIAADLYQRPNFITPFFIACASKNSKFTGIAVVCLQRLVAARALPRSRLKEVLDAFREATSGNLDVQLKILQSLPVLLQLYAADIHGSLVASLLNVCSILQSSKNATVNNTAAATLQQLVVAVFDKVAAEDRTKSEAPAVTVVTVNEVEIALQAAAYDAYRVFDDLCLLTQSQRPNFLRIATLPETFGLELIESILTNHSNIFATHAEQAAVLKTRLMPLVIRSLSARHNFAITMRVIRILYTLLRRHLTILAADGELALAALIQMLEPSVPQWKRALCMEVFRGIFAESVLVRQIFSLYDATADKRTILGDTIAAFVKLSAEKPNIIGLSSQSTVPTGGQYSGSSQTNDQAVLEASGIPGIITSPSGPAEASVGISTLSSSMRIPCIDQLDKSEPPPIPESYIYALVLNCVNSFSEGLARFILPLTVPSESRSRKKRTIDAQKESTESLDKNDDSIPRLRDRATSFRRNPVPINPLTLDDRPVLEQVKVCAAIVDACWPAVLATCSTFFCAALDSDHYHDLVRSFQKFTHIAGLLRLSTPRDAFLTTLGKHAVPSNVLKASSGTTSVPQTPSVESNSIFSNARGLLSAESLINAASPGFDRSRQTSLSESPSTLNTRNLLCLRALLNLGIALGPLLDMAWLIILECLQQAEFVLSSTTGKSRKSSTNIGTNPDVQSGMNNSALLANFGSEIKAFETASSRLFESTIDFPNQSFLDVLAALCKLFSADSALEEITIPFTFLAPSPIGSARRMSHQRSASASITSNVQNQEDFFALAKLEDVAAINIDRLVAYGPEISGWTMLTSELITSMTNSSIEGPVRLKAAEVLIKIILQAAVAALTLKEEVRADVHVRLFKTLGEPLKRLETVQRDNSVTSGTVVTDVHRILLEGCKSLLEQCGDTLINGWDIVFDIIASVFVEIFTQTATSVPHVTKSPRLTVTFFWDVSDFISSRAVSLVVKSDYMQSEAEVMSSKVVVGQDDAQLSGKLWMALLLRLTVVTDDGRLELRNSAIHTLLRIFDAHGDRLTSGTWSICLRSILFKIFYSITARLELPTNERSIQSGASSAWIETTVVVLGGVSDLLTTYLHILQQDSSFKSCWTELIAHLRSFITLGILDVSTAVYGALNNILAEAVRNDVKLRNFDASIKRTAWELWSESLPTNKKNDQTSRDNNQACLVAYVSCLSNVYILVQEDMDRKRTLRILNLLKEAIQKADLEAYSVDVDYLTPLQAQVLDALKSLRSDIKGVPALMISLAADLVKMAFASSDTSQGRERPTCVALSKAAMPLLENLIVTHVADDEVFTSGAVSQALEALSIPIDLKYSFTIITKSTPPWRVASSTSITILLVVLSIKNLKLLDEAQSRNMWTSATAIISGVIAADATQAPSGEALLSDQDFDIECFHTLRVLMIPLLGNDLVPDKNRRAFVDSLFHTSFVHQPLPRDLPKPGQDLLACLSAHRRGRTVDPRPSYRSKMSYVCLTELFSLVSLHDSSPECVKLAQVAAPYLILRIGLTFKAYIADQPLRGLMPPPRSQRKEMLFLLKELTGLTCEPRAIPDTPGLDSEGRRHLHRLYPLLVQMLKAAARDDEILDWVGRALAEVGADFGI